MAKKSVEVVLKMPVLPSEIKINTPENWCWARLLQLYNFIDYRGKTPNKIETGVPLVTAKNIRMGYLDYTIADFISRAEYEQRQSRGISRRGDILFTTEAPMGNVAIADLDEYSAGQRVITFQKRPEIEWVSNQFYFYYIMSCYFQDELQHNKTGNTVEGIKAEKLMRFPVPVPPHAEQQRIVDRIEYLFAKLDEAKEKAQSVLDSFETRKAAILYKAFSGELTAKWRAEHGVNMTGWTHSHLGTYADSQYGYTESATTDPIGPHFLRITDIQDGQVNWASVPYCKIDSEKKNQYAIHRGDIVVARTGATTGKSYLVIDDVDAVYASYLIRVSLKSDLLNNRYLHAFMQSPEYWRQISDFSSGIAQPGVNGKKLKELELPIPSASEQYEIVRILDSLFAKEQQAKEAAEAVLEKIDLLKKSILARAFRGELGTNDPSEESAEELLRAII